MTVLRFGLAAPIRDGIHITCLRLLTEPSKATALARIEDGG